jgi:D-cysteine desulfhydrase family pyridoxal phosphate-dependent enzyme
VTYSRFMCGSRDSWRGIPRVVLTVTPTPLNHAPRLSEALGVEVFLKRDDIGSLGLAGNKVRKLEFLLADALEEGATAMIVLGAPQSNAIRTTAAVAAQAGLACHAIVDGEEVAPLDGNLLLDDLFGAQIHPSGDQDWEALDRAAAELEDSLRAEGSRPYRMPVGCSSPVGTLGFARAYEELVQQLPANAGIQTIYHASTSGGTHAGLALGRKLLGEGPMICGIDAGRLYEDVPATVLELANASGGLLDDGPEIDRDDLDLRFDYVGPAYGVSTPEAIQALQLLARTEGILADPVYSAKALAALAGDARAGRITGPVVFWHTGGAPACFAGRYARELTHSQ